MAAQIPTWVVIHIYGFWVAIIALIVVGAVWAIMEFWITPKEAKIIRKASRKKKPLDFEVNDDGFGFFKILEYRGDEGYAATSRNVEDKNRVTKFFGRPRAITRQGIPDEARFIHDLTARKVYLPHARIPIWFSYAGKSILTNILALAGLQMNKEITRIVQDDNVKLSWQDKMKVIEEAAKKGVKTFVDFTIISGMFPFAWDESQIRGSNLDSYNDGYLSKQWLLGKDVFKWIILMLFAVGFCFGMAILASFVFGAFAGVAFMPMAANVKFLKKPISRVVHLECR